MKLKEGVSLDGLRPEIIKIIPILDRIFEHAGIDHTITCTTGGHKMADPHSWGFAIDSRTHGLDPDHQEVVRESIQSEIGPKYYVKLEDPGGPNEHIHTQVRKDIWREIVTSEGNPV